MLPNAIYTCKMLKTWENQYKTMVTEENDSVVNSFTLKERSVLLFSVC